MQIVKIPTEVIIVNVNQDSPGMVWNAQVSAEPTPNSGCFFIW
jgi:hypothetical protein